MSSISATMCRWSPCSVSGRQASDTRPRTCLPLRFRRLAPLHSTGKGFDSSTDQATPGAPSSSGVNPDSVEALEDRIRGNRKKKVEAKVKVNAPAVDAASGKTAPTPEAEFETKIVTALFAIFLGIMVEGLLLAASGFLPEEVDAAIATNLYPLFTPTVLAFVGASSLYGLWKTGKLPGQTQL